MSAKITYAIALSGGVDSAVAAYLIKQSGHNVFAIFMRNWYADDANCSAEQDMIMATRVANQLQIKLHIVDFSKEYQDEVFQNFLDDYAKGLTPNPDILCNKNIKFNHLWQAARHLGADKIATGHYARIVDNQLREGIDKTKDQSYFLCALTKEQLNNAYFPLGGYTKTYVRELAKNIDLINFAKKDSVGICFIEPKSFKEFLGNYLLSKPGLIIDEHGQNLGQHNGLAFYTIGQRSGLNIGGKAAGNGQPWYVADKDTSKNILTVVQGKDNPLLFKDKMLVSPPSSALTNLTLTARIRHLGTKYNCKILTQNEQYVVHFTEPVRAITPGQYVAYYQKDICLGYSKIIG